MLTDVMSDHALEQLQRFRTREKDTLDLIFHISSCSFQDLVGWLFWV